MAIPAPKGDWNDYEKLVLQELERNHDEHENIFKVLHRLEVSVAILKLKAAIIAVAISTGLSVGVSLLLRKLWGA